MESFLAGGEEGGEVEPEALESEKMPDDLDLRDAFFLKSDHTSITPLSSESVESLGFLNGVRMERRISS
jgi:hypothetical protein